MQTLIIDDEKHCREGLSIMLSKYCPGIRIVDQCASGPEALQAIGRFPIDLLFLDIEMPGMSGFQVLEQCSDRNFQVIFVTAYNEYAIQAIRHSALDYLVKPVDRDELIRAVARAKETRQAAASPSIAQLLERINANKAVERIALPTIEGLIIIDTREIMYCESEDSYSRFYLGSGKPVVVAQTLKKVEALLGGCKDFLRIHNSYIINLQYVRRYIRGDGGEVSLTDGKTLPVSRTKKQEFLERLKRL